MRRVAAAAAAAVLLALPLAGCSGSVSKADAYKIGCPAVDAAVAGGSVASKVTVSGLKALRDSGQLDPEPQKWIEATIDLLDSSDHKPTSDSAKKLIIDGCANNGYPLRNLT